MKKRKLTPFGLEVRKKLLERGMTDEDMARDLGIKCTNTIRDLLYGERSALKIRARVTEYLDLDSQYREDVASNE